MDLHTILNLTLTCLLLPAIFNWLQRLLVFLFNPERVGNKIAHFCRCLGNAESNVKEMQEEMRQLELVSKDLPKRKLLADWIEKVESVNGKVTSISNKYDRRLRVVGFRFVSFWTIYRASKFAEHVKDEIRKLKSAVPPRPVIPAVPKRVSVEGMDNDVTGDSIILKEMIVSSKGKLVGMKEKMDQLMELLTNEEPNHMIISIRGPMGVGKTALVCELDSTVLVEHFDHIASVTVPLGGKADEVLKVIVKQVSGKDDTSNKPAALVLRNVLGQGKYLIILDEVEAKEDFDRLWHSFPRANSASRVIITTRSEEVARAAQPMCQIMIEPLKEDDAKELFSSRVLTGSANKQNKFIQSETEDSEEQGPPCPSIPSELQDTADKIIQMCGRVPLGILCFANAFSQLKMEKEEWERFNDNLRWNFMYNKSLSPLKHLVNVSFKKLPEHLKSSLLLSSMFPVDYVFKRKGFLRMLVAEGFINQGGHSTPEDVAEQCLNKLFRSNMFEVVERNEAGSVKAFKLNTYMQIIISEISKRESFGMFFVDLKNLQNCSEVHHLSLHECNRQEVSTIEAPQLRSVLATTSYISLNFLFSIVRHSKNLTVLHLEDSRIDKLPDEIGHLINLRYLNLRRTTVAELPKTIGNLIHLLTLDIYSTNIEELPPELIELKKLRQFFAGKIDYASQTFIGVKPPKGVTDMTDLRTIYVLEASEKFLSQLWNLFNLRSLGLIKVEKIHCEVLCAALNRLRSLTSLRIVASNENERLDLTGLDDAVLKRLQKFELHARLTEAAAKSFLRCLTKNSMNLNYSTLRWNEEAGKSGTRGHLENSINLSYLYLGWTGLREGQLRFLGRLNNLRTLILNKAFIGEELFFTAKSFPQLKSLFLDNMPNLKTVMFDEMSSPKLEQLALLNLKNVTEVPRGIHFLESLKVLRVSGVPNEFMKSLEECNSRYNPKFSIDVVVPTETEPESTVQEKKRPFSFVKISTLISKKCLMLLAVVSLCSLLGASRRARLQLGRRII